ncbi:MAG: hypothetical protein ABJA70_22185 [Chryseolinea sp.]
MESYDPIAHFIDRIVRDDRLRPIHISLSIALCQAWALNEFRSPYRTSRRHLMAASHIRSKATYHKVLMELTKFGYVKYSPSFHPLKASEVEIINEEKGELR